MSEKNKIWPESVMGLSWHSREDCNCNLQILLRQSFKSNR
jgi:hypothetical protein